MEEILFFILGILLVIITVLIIWKILLERVKINNIIKLIISIIIFFAGFGALSFFIKSVHDKIYWLAIVYLFLFAIDTVVDWIRFLLELRKK